MPRYPTNKNVLARPYSEAFLHNDEQVSKQDIGKKVFPCFVQRKLYLRCQSIFIWEMSDEEYILLVIPTQNDQQTILNPYNSSQYSR